MATELRSRMEWESASSADWGWMLGIGILIMLIGLLSFSLAVFTTIASVIVLGLFVLAAGIAEVVYAFAERKRRGFAHQLFIGILYGVAGFVMTFWPVTSAATLTLFLAALLMVSGIIRFVMAIAERAGAWAWSAFSGVLSILLGIMILNRWPGSGLWVIGMFIGIDLLLLGASIVSSSFRVRQVERSFA